MNKNTLSVIIPAHNEANNIASCIEHLLNQKRKVDEIIVVVNDSKDRTASIARSFKEAKVIEVNQKGLINARNIGFNTAKSTILARINADVECEEDWSHKILKMFEEQSIDGVGGYAKTWSIPFWPFLYSTFWSRVYIWFAESYFTIPILWGANMAITKNAWALMKDEICLNDDEVHEDQDISIHMAAKDLKCMKSAGMLVRTSESSYYKWQKLIYYNQLRVKTKKTHKTLLSKCSNRLNLIQRFWRLMVVALPGSTFFLTSLVVHFIAMLRNRLSGKVR